MEGGWWCEFNDDLPNPKWRTVADAAKVPLIHVQGVVLALRRSACIARKDGWIGDFDFEDCASMLGIPAEHVAEITRLLYAKGWIIDDYISDWDRQPVKPDKSAADRQRNKRARDKAARNKKMGIADPEELAALERLGELSRVTAAREAGPRPLPPIMPFEPMRVIDRNPDLSRQANEASARVWLYGAGTMFECGAGAAIIAEYSGITPRSAEWDIRRWAESVDVVTIATIISLLHFQRLDRAAFRQLLADRLAEAAEEQKNGPLLRFGIAHKKFGGAA
jgi:hypothetical protein